MKTLDLKILEKKILHDIILNLYNNKIYNIKFKLEININNFYDYCVGIFIFINNKKNLLEYKYGYFNSIDKEKYFLDFNVFLLNFYDYLEEVIDRNNQYYINRCFECGKFFISSSKKFDKIRCQECINKSLKLNNTAKVYFVYSEYTNLIKIGYSQNYKRRIKALSNQQGCELKILKLIDGDFKLEKNIHELFSKYQVKGEWFTPNQEIYDYIKNIKEEENKQHD